MASITSTDDKKNTDCYYFFNGDKCSKGDKCEYRHNDQARDTEKLCIHYQKGYCKTGPLCPYRHTIASTVHPHINKATVSSGSRPQCRFYQQGTCNKGDACPFEHHEVNVNTADNDEHDSHTTKKLPASVLSRLGPKKEMEVKSTEVRYICYLFCATPVI